MIFSVDTNVLFTFFGKTSPARYFIINSKLFNFQLFSSKYVLKELKDNKSDILKYSKSNIEEIEFAFKELKKYVKFMPSKSFKQFESEAKQLAPHDKDIPPFALALSLNCSLWSNEPGHKKQKVVSVYSTEDLSKEFGLKLKEVFSFLSSKFP